MLKFARPSRAVAWCPIASWVSIVSDVGHQTNSLKIFSAAWCPESAHHSAAALKHMETKEAEEEKRLRELAHVKSLPKEIVYLPIGSLVNDQRVFIQPVFRIKSFEDGPDDELVVVATLILSVHAN